MDLDPLVGDGACEALSHAEEEDEVMEMMEPDAADIMMGRFYEIDHSKLPLIPRDARRKRFLEGSIKHLQAFARKEVLPLLGVAKDLEDPQNLLLHLKNYYEIL
jgi:hypothetical protein